MSPIATETLSVAFDRVALKNQLRTDQEVVEALTLEEKISLLSGRSFCDTPGVPRLSVAPIKVSDGPSGCRGELSHDGPSSAVFPNASCLASSFDPALMELVGIELGKECLLKDVQILIGPTINLHRDPRGGRNFECFSEDPLLTGIMGSAYVKGLQSQGVGACLKHLVCNERETHRKSYDAKISMKALREVYLKPFQHIMREADPYSIMTAYNDVNGEPASHSEAVLDIVRKEFNYDGLIMSDWFGTKDGIKSLEAGVDLEMPFPVMRGGRLLEAVRSGKIEQRYIDDAVVRMIKTARKTSAPQTRTPEKPFDNDPKRIALCRQAASEGAVLLRNNNQVLPLPLDANVLIIGEPAERPAMGGGGSAMLSAPYLSTPLDAIRRAGTGSIKYHPGVPTWRLVPELDSTFCENIDIALVNDGDAKPIWTDSRERASISLLDQRISGLSDKFTLELQAKITPVSSGSHTLALFCVAETEIYLDDKLIHTVNPPHISVEQFLFERFDFETRLPIDLTAGTPVNLKIVSKSKQRTGFEPPAQGLSVGLVYDRDEQQAIAECSDLAAKADYVVVMTGLNKDWEGEGTDRADIRLPRKQEELVRAVAKVGQRVVLVNQSGSPIDFRCADEVDSIVQAFYGGMECGNVISDILFGQVNPSGRLAMTFPVSTEQCPTYKSFQDDSQGLIYEEESLFGYRSYQQMGIKPAYPFGFGQSYTTFEWSSANITNTGDGITINLVTKNTGRYSGKEVVQCYASCGDAEPRRLEAFVKTTELSPGSTEALKLRVSLDAFARWEESSWVPSSGTWRVSLCKDSETEVIGFDVEL